jgi:hypothetical protein
VTVEGSAEIDLRTTVVAGPEQFGLGVIDTCPECGSDDLVAVDDGRRTNIFCNSCGACWWMSMGWVRRVNPLLGEAREPIDVPRVWPTRRMPGEAGSR